MKCECRDSQHSSLPKMAVAKVMALCTNIGFASCTSIFIAFRNEHRRKNTQATTMYRLQMQTTDNQPNYKLLHRSFVEIFVCCSFVCLSLGFFVCEHSMLFCVYIIFQQSINSDGICSNSHMAVAMKSNFFSLLAMCCHIARGLFSLYVFIFFFLSSPSGTKLSIKEDSRTVRLPIRNLFYGEEHTVV